MSTKRRNGLESFKRVKDTLAEACLAMSDQDLVDEVKDGRAEPEEARSRVLQLYQSARRIAAEELRRTPFAKEPTKLLNIDATRARAILRDVAARADPVALPWRAAAQLAPSKSDEEAIKAVGELRDLGVVSDDELK